MEETERTEAKAKLRKPKPAPKTEEKPENVKKEAETIGEEAAKETEKVE